MALELFANASLYTPAEPESIETLDVSYNVIEGIVLRMLHVNSTMVAHEIATALCLPFFNVVEPVLNQLREMHLLEILRGDRAMSYVYTITNAGRERALQYFEQTTYVGPAPVSLESYVKAIKAQSLKNITVNSERLRDAFDGLVFEEAILEAIGPAVNSGRSIFLYGPPGNGKTSICERIVASFGGSIFIPSIISVSGQLIRIFDEYNHQEVGADEDIRLQGRYDKRYKLIRRPIIIVGGELTMESLDLVWNNESRFYEAPFQMKANGGAFMIDDFGRQRIEPKTLLNRWIVPLEKKIDFLTLHTGTKMEVPFDELIVFSTNLNPKALVDDAFLRRIRYKIPINDPSHEAFRAIWKIVSEAKGVPYADELVDYFVYKFMRSQGRPLRGCIPRDILDNIVDVCRFKQIDLTITVEMLDDAAKAYFVKFEDDESGYKPSL
ncbi:AAA family ATPase [Verrucomicrobia bacterium LW23]|nr:AAA family ATPase [Verrucomicrobia bacterium LW23]